MMNDPRYILQSVFGFSDFRPGQEVLIKTILSGRDVLGVMPTGGGKSLCYEIPALLLPGLTLVISPLIALMIDQVDHLQKAGVAASCIHAHLYKDELAQVLQEIRARHVRILFVSPERLSSPAFLSALRNVSISFLCVDEAHCLISWGRTFRPSYQKIPHFLSSLPIRPVVAAFTATADPATQASIASGLSLVRPARLVTGFDRPNLYYCVARPTDRKQAILAFLKGREGQSGIIYCRTRRTTMTICRFLKRRGHHVLPYHAGRPSEERARVQEAFMNGSIPLVVATNAFGLGIDKSDVRFVLHYNMPGDIESYYQEAGRAGRDGKEATCLLFADTNDVRMGHYFIDRIDEEVEVSYAKEDRGKLRDMMRYVAETHCYGNHLRRYFGEPVTGPCGHCALCRMRVHPALHLTQKEKDERLLAHLIELRLRLSKEYGIRQDKIATTTVLTQMVRAKPRTRLDLFLMDVWSLPNIIRYGSFFLEEIEVYTEFLGDPLDEDNNA